MRQFRFLNPRFWEYVRQEYFPTAGEVEARKQRIEVARFQRRAQVVDACDLCSGRSVYLCPHCREAISSHSHENDFICERHGFVSPVRESDGAIVNGDGRCGMTQFTPRRDYLRQQIGGYAR